MSVRSLIIIVLAALFLLAAEGCMRNASLPRKSESVATQPANTNGNSGDQTQPRERTTVLQADDGETTKKGSTDQTAPGDAVLPGGNAAPEANILVELPQPGQAVSSPFVIKGKARVFEGTVNYRLLSRDGNLLVEGFTTATHGGPEFGEFQAEVKFSNAISGEEQGKLKVFTYSAKDGSIENLVEIPVRLLPVKQEAQEVVPVLLQEAGQKTFRLRLLSGLPKYVTMVKWLDNQRVLAQAGSNPLVLDVDSAKYRALNLNAWWVSLAPNKETLAYATEDGLHLVNINGEDDRLVMPREKNGEKMPVDGLIWAPSSRQFLTWKTFEWDAQYFLFDVDSGKLKPVNTRLEGYFLSEAVAWLDESRVLFTTRANRKHDGTQEYTSGYRQDLAVANLKEDSFQLITHVDDGVFLEKVKLLDSEKILYQERRLEGDLQEGGIRWVIKDLNSSKEQPLDLPGTPWEVYYNEATGEVMYLNGYQQESMNNYQQVLNRQGEVLLEVRYGDKFSGLIWSPEGRRAAISLSAHQPSGTGFVAQYYLYILERL